VILSAYRRQQQIKRAIDEARKEARRLWRQVDRDAALPSWREFLPRMTALIASMQVLAAQTADTYVGEALAAQELDMPPEGTVAPGGLAGFTSDGWPLASLLVMPAVETVRLMQRGMPTSRAFASGQTSLELIAGTQVGDGFRIADSVAGTARRVTTYVRVLGPRPCSRCIMLAGEISWSTAFKRHPNCACSTLPSTRIEGREFETDPNLYFESLSEAEQDRVFTKAGAQAIRDGADMNRVVNARRRAAGMRSASDYARTRRWRRRRGTEWADLAAAEGTVTGRGRLQRRATLAGDRFVTFEDPLELPGGVVAPRLMPESIYEIAESQEHAIRLLKRHGYIY
jgi:hypothetical protein